MEAGGTAKALLLALLVAASTAHAETAREILDRRKLLDDTTRRWSDRYQQMTMEIFDARGAKRTRTLDIYERKYPKDEQKTILFFSSPAEVNGTGFLSFTHPGKPAEQWLYLPAVKRVRKITASTRNERFVGTDLTYHELDLLSEMPSWTEEDAKSALLGEEIIDGVPCYAIEFRTRRDDVEYGRILLWLGKEDLAPRKVDFLEEPDEGWLGGLFGEKSQDGKGLKKRVQLRDVRLIGSIPIAHDMFVETPGAETKTEIHTRNVKFDQGLRDDLFTHRSLQRGKP
jgi:hypothetical protein